MDKRKVVTPKIKLQVLGFNNYTCVICGRSPVTNPGLDLEVDHVKPFSKGGQDSLENLQTLCRDCNRGKGANEELNKLLKNDIDILLNKINPQILKGLSIHSEMRVVANQEDFSDLFTKNNNNFYSIEIIPNTIIGFGAGQKMGIYTVSDTGGQKTNFLIRVNKLHTVK